jgi:hypothetical protein
VIRNLCSKLGVISETQEHPMERGEKNRDIRQFQSDGRLARRSCSDAVSPNAGDVDTLTLAMRQLMQLPGQMTEELQRSWKVSA